MTVALFDPIQGPKGGWLDGVAMERAYLEAFARNGSQAMISNLRTTVVGLAHEERIFPVTVNEAEYGDAYVCLPHTAYSLYAKAELGLVDAGPWTPALAGLADLAGLGLKAARFNRIVNLGNWMLSTNLHGGWRGEGLTEMRQVLAGAYPDHLLGVRSVNGWSDGPLLEALKADGWRLLPSRQIYVTDDLTRDWRGRRDTGRDLALLQGPEFTLDRFEQMSAVDAEDIARLYGLLYLDRYSDLNPVFTPEFIAMTHASGVFRYRGVRNDEGRLESVVGAFVRGGVLTTPVVGYDTARPPRDGLYRIASALLAQMAFEGGLKLNGSAGAAAFKRNRGARPVIEYWAMHAGHLSAARRGALRGLEMVLDRIAAPLMQERGL